MTVSLMEPRIEATDLDLVRRAQAGDAEAFGQLVERNRRVVFRAALACVRSPAEADDVAQDVFLAAFRKLGTFRGDAQFRTWLLAITWRKAVDRRTSVVRWLKRTVSPGAGDADDRGGDALERVASADRSQEQSVADADMQRHVARLIGTLPKRLRDALLLSGTGEHTYAEIGGMLGIPVGTLKWRVAEARRLLRMKLVALGYGHD